MKKLLCLILCALIALVPLCACGESDDVDIPSESDADTGNRWMDVRFSEAEKIYAWFSGCGKPACNPSATFDRDGTEYIRVTEPGLTDAAALRSLLGEYFSEELVQSLMETEVYSGAPMFVEQDGRLYYCSSVSGQVPYDIGERIGTIDSQTDSEIVYRIDLTYDYYASSFAASYDFHLVPGEDGQWRFQNFQLPALLIAEQMFMSDNEE